ncbi:transposase-like protein [Corynebacterium striatum]|uniref:Transposase n=1 Tax=Corynebacterium striatum TaxID=43770 RepID=A0ABC9ZJR6_CORST|nr:hypothetical protein Cst04h_04130 [Corynebacterium striatum]STD56761.1 transposase-like protein [Corynebacterium striatum]
MIRFQFVYDHRTEYSVKRMCHVLKLNRSSLVKSADVVYEFFRIVGDRLAGIGSGTGLGVVGH